MNSKENPELFNVIGTTYGAGGGYNDFNLPDYRGVFLRGVDNGRNLDSGRQMATYQEDAMQSHSHTATVKPNQNLFWSSSIKASEWKSGFGNGSLFHDNGASGISRIGTSFTVNVHPYGGCSENRPKNMSVRYIIRVK